MDLPSLIPAPDPAPLARFRAVLDQLHPISDARLGVAVSGGPDSLALLLLAHAALPGRIEVATVDHGLRPESANEAAFVAAICARLGVPHTTLKGAWDSDATQGLQAAARAYRYRELADWCALRSLPRLATAHHADDQAETLLMRLARGSGIGGFSAIRAARPLNGAGEAWPVTLVRPLLGFTKAELQDIVTAAELRSVADPSNVDPRYDRTRARRLLAETDWLRADRLAASASHLADAGQALQWAAEREGERRVRRIETAGRPPEWRLDPAGLPTELLRRIVLGVCAAIRDHAGEPCLTGPSGPDLTRFIARLGAGDTATLGPVLARPGPPWRFTVAPPRRSHPDRV